MNTVTAKQHFDQIQAVREQLSQVQQATSEFGQNQRPKVNLQYIIDDLKKYETWAESNAENIQQALKSQTRGAGSSQT